MTQRHDGVTLVVVSHETGDGYLACAACGASDVDDDLALFAGWRLDGGRWRCPACLEPQSWPAEAVSDVHQTLNANESDPGERQSGSGPAPGEPA